MSKFVKFIIWFSAITLIFLGIIYFSYSQNRQLFKIDDESLQAQADQLLTDNQELLDAPLDQGWEPVRPINDTDHLWGTAQAPVQLIVYVDFDCPFCAEYQQTLKQVKEEYKDQVVIAFRIYPLASHPNAIPAALAAECASDQGKFWEMTEKLYANQKESKNETAEFIKDAEELNLNKEDFKKCLLEERYKEEIIADKAEAEKYGVTGTPTSFLGNNILPGAYQFNDFEDQTGRKYEGLKTLIDKALQ
ncbi:MAG: thioredoxin domain-containing protein [bacterium]